VALTAPGVDAAKARPQVPDHPLMSSMSNEDKVAFETIASQPEALHSAILEVATHEHILVQLPALWNDFELAVGGTVQELDEEDRKALQHLVQHPGLLEALVEGGPHDQIVLRRRLEAYPNEIAEVALNAGLDHYGLVSTLHAEVAVAVHDFEALIGTSSPRTQAAFREVVGYPQLTSLLIEQLEATRQLGGAMRVDPEGTTASFAILGSDVRRARLQAEEEAEQRRIAEERARREAAAREAQRRAERRANRLYWGRYPYWGSSACWYGDPHFHHYRYMGHRRCWYPWHRYRRAWW
jgi:hypothetical protein